jgi:hypothetical protein
MIFERMLFFLSVSASALQWLTKEKGQDKNHLHPFVIFYDNRRGARASEWWASSRQHNWRNILEPEKVSRQSARTRLFLLVN